MKTIGQRIRHARKEAGQTQADLAHHMGKSVQAVSQWETGNTGGKEIAKIAVFLGVGVDWLLTGDGNSHAGGSIAAAASQGRRLVPRLNLVQIEGRDAAATAEVRERIATHFPCGARSFNIVVNDLANAPHYEPGDSVIIDPDLEPRPTDMILARVSSQDKPVFRQFLPVKIERLKVTADLVPRNEQWPTIPMTTSVGEKGQIIGVMSEVAKPRRA